MRWLLLVVIVAFAAGCGGREKAAEDTLSAQIAKLRATCTEGVGCPRPGGQPTGRSCEPAGAGYHGRGFRTCWGPNPNHPNPTLERRTSSGWALVTGPMTPHDMSAQWGSVWVSPDHRTLLADWQYPCDSSAVVFVPAAGGKPRLVTGERDWRNAPVARALGWTRDGKARVRLYRPWRGHHVDPRRGTVFLFDPLAPARDARPLPQPGC